MIVDGRELLQFGGLMTISLYYLSRIINKGVNTRKKRPQDYNDWERDVLNV